MKKTGIKIMYKPDTISKEYMMVKYDIKTKELDLADILIGVDYEGIDTTSKPMLCMGDVLMFIIPKEYYRTEDSINELIEQLMGLQEEISNHELTIEFIRIASLEHVLSQFKKGEVISRVGWNGKKIVYRKGYEYTTPNQQTIDQWGLSEYDHISVDPYIQMKDGWKLSSYVFTAEDIMADDWFVVK